MKSPIYLCTGWPLTQLEQQGPSARISWKPLCRIPAIGAALLQPGLSATVLLHYFWFLWCLMSKLHQIASWKVQLYTIDATCRMPRHWHYWIFNLKLPLHWTQVIESEHGEDMALRSGKLSCADSLSETDVGDAEAVTTASTEAPIWESFGV